MRIGVGYLLQESNTFSPVETHLRDFHPQFGAALLDRWRGTRTEIGAFLDVLEPSGHEIVPLFAGWAMTAGPMSAETFDQLKTKVTRQAREDGPFDALLLALHGSLSAAETDDCDGELLEALREIAGPVALVALTLDLHANVTAKIASNADAVVGYKTYPHTDMYEAGLAAAEILVRALRGEVRPVTVMQKLPLIVPPENMQTTDGPMKEVFDAAEACREAHPEILSVSVFGVQPWLDIGEMGCATLAVADGNTDRAAACVRRAAQRFWDLRDRFDATLTPPEEAIREALAAGGGPVILAESADSPTAGAPGDSAELLRLLLQETPDVPALVWVRDPQAVEQAWSLRPGDSIHASLGARFNPAQYEPVSIEGRVRSMSDGRFVFRGAYNHGMVNEMGRTVVIGAGAVSIVVSEEAASMIGTEVYRSQGLEPKDHKIVVVKSANSFRSEYGPFMVKAIMVDTPGLSSSNLRSLPYRRVSRPIHPLDPVEFSTATG